MSRQQDAGQARGRIAPATQGGYDYELEWRGEVEHGRFECPICLLCLREPVLTSCGHRFCQGCISTWLLKEGGRCPLDGSVLERGDLFPDKCTQREILQARARCPFASCGCPSPPLPLLHMEAHVRTCSFQPPATCASRDTQGAPGREESKEESTLVSCQFSAVGCEARLPAGELQAHLEACTQQHLQLLQEACLRLTAPVPTAAALWPAELRQVGGEQEEAAAGEDAYEFRRQRSWDCTRFNRKGSTHLSAKGRTQAGVETERLLKAMYERLVCLEQRSLEQEARVERLSRALTQRCSEEEAEARRLCQGRFCWRLRGFSRMVRDTPTERLLLFSPTFCTHPYGYRLCLRLNLHRSDASTTHVSLFLHLCRGQYDASLSWPFHARLRLRLLHPSDPPSTVEETVLCPGGSLEAFQRPVLPRNPKGYGYADFVPLDKVMAGGFLDEGGALLVRVDVDAEEDRRRRTSSFAQDEEDVPCECYGEASHHQRDWTFYS